MKIGKNYLFRTVTMIYTGELVEEKDDLFILKKAAWIIDTGRWSNSLKSCSFCEVEPYPKDKLVYIFKAGMLDIVEIDHLPLEQK